MVALYLKKINEYCVVKKVDCDSYLPTNTHHQAHRSVISF